MNNILFTNFWQGLIYCLVAFFGIWVAKIFADLRTTKFDDDREIEEKSNKGVGFRRAGLYIGIGIGIAGALSGNAVHDFWTDLFTLIIDGTLITTCLFLGREVCDKVMLAGINNDDEVQEGNTAVGLAECGMYLATGCILNGAFSGDGTVKLIIGLLSAIVFFVIGQIALCICGYIYELITSFNVKEEIKKNNAAAGLALGGILFALGIILRASLTGDFVDWITDITSFSLCAGYGMLMLLVFKKLIDKFLLPNTSLRAEIKDQNVAALAMTEGAIIAVALIISSVI
ncbi:MAG: DUF350 domain-containing protein [Nanoarchaeota archaeon]|nr:DUF350 domain-containing protein [Nanoarchaeota archaeon]